MLQKPISFSLKRFLGTPLLITFGGAKGLVPYRTRWDRLYAGRWEKRGAISEVEVIQGVCNIKSNASQQPKTPTGGPQLSVKWISSYLLLKQPFFFKLKYIMDIQCYISFKCRPLWLKVYILRHAHSSVVTVTIQNHWLYSLTYHPFIPITYLFHKRKLVTHYPSPI